MNTEYSLHIIQNRRRFVAACAGLGIGTATFHRALAALVAQGGELTGEMIALLLQTALTPTPSQPTLDEKIR